MIKTGMILVFMGMVLTLGLTLPDFSLLTRLDPVPSGQKVAHSSHCKGCHGYDETQLALVDSKGQDVSIADDWQFSMMGLSAHDPFWRATLAHEISHYPGAKQAIESTCLTCHAPLGHVHARLNGLAYTFEKMLADSLGLDGVSCSACHQQPAEGLGLGHSGHFNMDTNRVLFGPYPNPFAGPMELYVGFKPVFSDHIYLSGVCAGCHTLITETLLEDGSPSGNYFVEQATYHEWLNSIFPAQGKECQTCHLPFLPDSVVIATDFQALEKRYPYGLHQFFGANTTMLQLMKTHSEALGLPEPQTPHAWDESISNNRRSLESAALLHIERIVVEKDTLSFEVIIRNKSGHKLPTGYPSRIAWVQVILKDASNQESIYTNGLLDPDGHIVGRNIPFEPHHQVSLSEDDVQTYELVMGDMAGELTTRLNGAYQPLKDNRILPIGFTLSHSTYDTVAIWGDASNDPDYTVSSALGMDKTIYRIGLNGRKGMVSLEVSLRYLALPSRWMNDLFLHDSIPLVSGFKSMYADFKRHDEVMASVQIENIDINSTSVSIVKASNAFTVFPNPNKDRVIHILLDDSVKDMSDLNFSIQSIRGEVIRQGRFENPITLQPGLPGGIYYYSLFKGSQRLGLTPFSIL